MPPDIIGRSFFREYVHPGEMIAFTASKLRRHTADNLRYECSADGRCLVGTAPEPAGLSSGGFRSGQGRRWRQQSWPRHRPWTASCTPGTETSQTLQFAEGELRRLPEQITSEWSDNLIGAQYLDFPANSKVHVSIRVRAVEAHESGIRMQAAAQAVGTPPG
jgi:hypothetical protein